MEELKRYLRNFIDSNIIIEEYIPNKLSILLKNNYTFYRVTFLGEDFLLVRPKQESPIDMLKKQLDIIQEKIQLKVILLENDLTIYRRKKLIEKRIPFIAEGKQMFLPFLGIDFSLKNEKISKKINIFTPTTQLVFLYCLYNMDNVITQKELAIKLNMSQMTISRALGELNNLKLIQYRIEGVNSRKKVYYIQDKGQYYKSGKQYLINPILKTVYMDMQISDRIMMLKSGLEALAENSMLSAPNRKIRAIYKDEYNKIECNYEVPAEMAREDTRYVQVQVLKYNPKILADADSVDPITMICTLENKDERIEQAIEESMEGFSWYRE